MSVKKSATEPNIEEAFKRHSPIAAKVKEEYEKALIDIFADMGYVFRWFWIVIVFACY